MDPRKFPRYEDFGARPVPEVVGQPNNVVRPDFANRTGSDGSSSEKAEVIIFPTKEKATLLSPAETSNTESPDEGNRSDGDFTTGRSPEVSVLQKVSYDPGWLNPNNDFAQRDLREFLEGVKNYNSRYGIDVNSTLQEEYGITTREGALKELVKTWNTIVTYENNQQEVGMLSGQAEKASRLLELLKKLPVDQVGKGGGVFKKVIRFLSNS